MVTVIASVLAWASKRQDSASEACHVEVTKAHVHTFARTLIVVMAGTTTMFTGCGDVVGWGAGGFCDAMAA